LRSLRSSSAKPGIKSSPNSSCIAVIRRKIEAGEAFDLAIPSPELIDDLIKQGKVAADTRTVFGRTGLGVAARQGLPKPDISTVDAFKRTLLNAKSVGHSKEGQTGVNFLIVLDKLGIAAEMKPKLKTYDGNQLAEALEKGTEEIGVTGIGPVLEMKDVQKLGRTSARDPALRQFQRGDQRKLEGTESGARAAEVHDDAGSGGGGEGEGVGAAVTWQSICFIYFGHYQHG
jgi:molybdate transport system substrate-binding protein